MYSRLTSGGSAAMVQVNLARASATNPGIPPSSLMAWLRANRSIAGAVLTEYDTAFSTADYDSPRDSADQIREAGIVGTAIAASQALARLAQQRGAATLPVCVLPVLWP